MEAAQLAAREISDGPWPETGFGWYDQATGCRVTASTPEAEPELWNQYLDGALESYRKHGLDWVLDLERIRDGADTTLFFAALDPQGRVVGGRGWWGRCGLRRIRTPCRSGKETRGFRCCAT